MNIHHVISQVVLWAVIESCGSDFSAVLVGNCQFLGSALIIHTNFYGYKFMKMIFSGFKALFNFISSFHFTCRITKCGRMVVCECRSIWISGEVDSRPLDVYLALASTHVPQFSPHRLLSLVSCLASIWFWDLLEPYVLYMHSTCGIWL